MLRKRILTALVLLVLVLIIIFYANDALFSFALALLILGGAYEWTSLIPIKKAVLSYVVVLILLCVLVVIYTMPLSDTFFILPLVFWCYLALVVILYPRAQSLWAYPWGVFLSMLVLLPACFAALYTIKNVDLGNAYLTYLLFLIWGADTGAYVSGKLFGRYKLIPHVSPGKTFEGVLGAVIIVMLFSLIGQCYFLPQDIFLWYTLSFITLIAAVFGDLLVSMLKRRVKCKDTGHILPGHGGILDRIDSLLPSSVVFVYFAHSWRLI